MSLDTKKARYGLREVQIWELLTDVAGGSFTYGNPLDLPIGMAFDLTTEVETVDLFGDDRKADIHVEPVGFTGSVEYGRDHLEAVAILAGGTVTYVGDTDATLTVLDTDEPKYFMVEARVVRNDGTSQERIRLFKCKMTGQNAGHKSKSFATQKMDFAAIGRDCDGKVYEKVVSSSLAALDTTADSTAPTVSSTVPADAATGIVGTANLTITWSEAMKASTLTSGENILLVKDAGTVVAVAITHDSSTHVTTINPTSTLDAAGTYTLNVGPGCRDLAGNAKAAWTSYNFTVAA